MSSVQNAGALHLENTGALHLENANELHLAFVAFNALSQQLIDSYRTLEQQVGEISTLPHDVQLPRGALRGVLKVLPAGVIVLDGAGIVIECNPAAVELLGVPLVAQSWGKIITRVFAPQADDGHDVSLHNGRRVHLATTPLGEEPGQVISITDVTQTRKLQEKVHQFERLSALGEMAGGLAHQLRTPLSTAILYLGMLKRTELSEAERLPLVEKTLARLRHLEALVRDMLLLVRADQDAGESISVSELLQRVHQYAQPHIPAGRIRFVMVDETCDPCIRAQPDVLVSALQNLITNAVQSIAAEGTVSIRAQLSEPGWVEFQVMDTGCGIAVADHARIGEMFFTTRDQGTGLGLAVVNAVVKAHHGSMSFSSTPGQGSSFSLHLPVLESIQPGNP